MQKLGSLASDGFYPEDLRRARGWFEDRGLSCDLHRLNDLLTGVEAEEAYFLVVKDGLTALTTGDLFQEVRGLDWDTKALMRGRVVNKRARYNLCFAHEDQEPDYGRGKGRVVSFSRVPLLGQVRSKIVEPFGDKARDLFVEGNFYPDVEKSYIGFHGDGERRRVIGVRLGSPFPFYYQWYHNGAKTGEMLELELGHGDLYAMSGKAVGTDWKKRKTPTLRHACGSRKTLKL